MEDNTIHLNEWYTYDEALARLEANAGRKLEKSIPRQLVRNNTVRYQKIGQQTLYWRADIDRYIVEQRGAKVARTQRQRAVETKRQQGQISGRHPRKQATGGKATEDNHGEYSMAIT